MKKRALRRGGRLFGETHWRAKFTDEEVRAVLFLRTEGLSYTAIAAKWDEPGHSMSPSTARAICDGRIRGFAQGAYRSK